MVRKNASRRAAPVLILGLGLTMATGWAGTAAADAITSTASPATGTSVFPSFATGNVATDMPSGTGVTVIPGQQMGDVYQPQWMTNAGLVNGYDMKDIRLSYDAKTDTLAVGVNFYGIAGNTDGTPNGGTNPLTTAAGGSNPANYGADKSTTIAFTPVTAAGTAAAPVVVAGVPADKTNAPTTTTDHFNVATYQASTAGLAHSYGQTLAGNLGNLAYNPSSAHPGFEFTIKNFSKLPGLNGLTNGFYVSAYTGSATTTIVGKSQIADTLVNAPNLIQSPEKIVNPPTVSQPTAPVPPNITTPEPATILAWGLVIGGAAWRARRRLRPTDRI